MSIKLLGATVGALLLLGACSAEVSVGGASIDQSDLEGQLVTMLTDDTSGEPAVTCDGDLDGEVDATQTCGVEWPDTGDATDVEVTVTAVKDGVADFSVAEVG